MSSTPNPTPELAPAPESAPAPAPAASPASEGMTPAACAAQLKQLFPALFAGTPKPVKLRIQADIQERAPGVFTKQVLSAFLRRHTGSHAYLLALTRSKERYDLDGQPAGELSEEHRKVAADELARRRENTESRIALEQQQRRNRATLLRDFQTTTLTVANFCALKGVPVDELEGLLEIARQEAKEAPPERRPDRRPGHRPEQRRDHRHDGRNEGRPGHQHKRR